MTIIDDPRSISRTLLTVLLATAVAACGDDGPPAGGESTGDDDMTSSAGTTGAATDSGMTDDSESTTDDPGSTSDEAESSESGDPGSTGSEQCEQDQIELPGDDFYPEGTAYDSEGMLYVASLATGQIVQTIPCETDPQELVAAGGPLRNPVGMIVDDARDWLIVCDSDFSFAAPPSIDVLELRTGALVATHEFDGPGFCNDLALDGDGNVYATDSAGARVLRVPTDELATDSPAETWATDPDFVVGEGEFGLNGIAWDEADGLYVVNSQQGELHRITIEGSGDAGAITPIVLDEGPLLSPDGMKWMGGDELLVIEGGLGALSRVTLDEDAASVEVVADGFDFPTTFGLIDGQAWVAEGQLEHFIGLDPAPPEPPFVVSRVPL